MWKDVFSSLLQGSILGPFVFNIHLRDPFYSLENSGIAIYPDDNTLYSSKKNKETNNNVIKIPWLALFNQFSDNFMKADSNKSHSLMISEEKTYENIDGTMIKSSLKEALLDINLTVN